MDRKINVSNTVGTFGGLKSPPPLLKAGYANGCNNVTNKYVLNIEIGVFKRICKNFASELASTYFLEFDVLSLAYIFESFIYCRAVKSNRQSALNLQMEQCEQ